MKYMTLEYRHSDNLGDDIQSLAAEQYLPRVDGYLDRDTGLDRVSEPAFVYMNGWFKHGPAHWREGATECWPPSPQLRPAFVGFHIAYPELLTPDFIAYCRQWAPIGCRDRGTMQLLLDHDVPAYFSRCLTLTFPRRTAAPASGAVYIVEGQKAIEDDIIPDDLKRGAVRRNHYVEPDLKTKTPLKRRMAQSLLNEYRDHAKLVITNLLHCAMPCVAMGIPVVFLSEPDPLYPDDYRLDPIKDLLHVHWPGDRIDWEPRAVDVTALAEGIRADSRRAAHRAEQS